MSVLLLLPVLLAAGYLGFIGLQRWPLVGALAITLILATEWEFPAESPLVVVAGASVYTLDAICGLMLLVALTQLSRLAANIGAARWILYGVLTLLIVGLLRGIGAFGAATAINEFRTFFYPLAVVFWAMSLHWTKATTDALIGTVSLVQGWVLSLLAVLHIAVYGFGSADDQLDVNGVFQTQRPLVSGQALALLFCAITVIALRQHGRPRWRAFSSAVFLLVVLIVQQRTVWACAAAALVALAFAVRARQLRALVGVAAAVAVGAVFVVPALLRTTGFSEVVASTQSTGTYDGRVTSWGALIAQAVTAGPETLLFGFPSGAGWARFEGPGRWVEFPPHNWYVTLLLRCGIVGLTLFVLLLVVLAVRALRLREAGAAAFVILVASAVYGWSYSWIPETGVFVGWSLIAGRTILSGRLRGRGEVEAQHDLLPVRRRGGVRSLRP